MTNKLEAQIAELVALSEAAIAPELKRDFLKRAAELRRLHRKGPKGYRAPDLPEAPSEA